MKNQALFCSKDKSKKLKCCLLQFLFGDMWVKVHFLMSKLMIIILKILSYRELCFHLGMAHSPAMHSPHVIHTLKSEGLGFAPVNSPYQVVRSHIPTPPRPISNNNSGTGSVGQHSPPPPMNTTGDNGTHHVSSFLILLVSLSSMICVLTLKAPIITAADGIHKYFFIVFQRK